MNLNYLITVTIAAILFAGCNTTDKISFSTQVIKIDFREIAKLDKQSNHSHRASMTISDDDYKYYCVTNDNLLIEFSMKSGPDTLYDFNTSSGSIFGLSRIGRAFVYYNERSNTLLKIDFDKKSELLLAKNVLHKSKYFLPGFYSQTSINKIGNGLYIVPIGDSEDRFNFSGKYMFTIIESSALEDDSHKYLIEYPEEFNDKYIHYSYFCHLFRERNIYYVFPTIDKIFRYNMIDSTYDQSVIPNGKYLDYDTTEMTNMLYLHDYTNKTVYNINIYGLDDYIVVLQRTDKQKYCFLIYDYDLNYLGRYKLNGTHYYQLIFSEANSLYCPIPHLHQILKIDIYAHAN